MKRTTDKSEDLSQKKGNMIYNNNMTIDSKTKYHLTKIPLKKLAKVGIPRRLQWEYLMAIPDPERPGHYLKRGMIRLGTRNESEARTKAAQWLQGKEDETNAEEAAKAVLAASQANLRTFCLETVWKEGSDYALDCEARGRPLSKSYIIAARSKLIKYFLPWCKENRVNLLPDLGKAELRRWRNWFFAYVQKKGMTTSNVNLCRAHISVVLRWAEAMDLIAYNPCRSVEPVKENKTERKPYSKEEIRKLLEAEGDIRAKVAVRLAATTGARLGEIIGLRWKNIDLDNCSMDICEQYQEILEIGYVLPKAKKAREAVHLTLEMVNDLKELKTAFPFGQVVFQDKKTRKPITRYEFGKALKALAKNAKVELNGRLWHSLRHSWISFMAEEAGLVATSKSVGHSNTKTTEGYIHQTDAAKEAEHRIIDGLFEAIS